MVQMKKCEKCQLDHEGSYGSGRFCSSSCARSFSTAASRSETTNKVLETFRRKREEVVLRESLTIICPVCNEAFKTRPTKSRKAKMFCSAKCSRTATGEKFAQAGIQAVKRSIENGTHKGWQSRNTLSYPEKFFKKVLEENGFLGKFLINFPLKKSSLGETCSGASYLLDFYFPEIKFDLEIDGKQHEYPDRIESDIKRDIALEKNGIIVHRIKWVSINNEKGRQSIKSEIQNLIDCLNQKFLHRRDPVVQEIV